MNSSTCDTVKTGGGNSINPPAQISPSSKWCFTLNNYSEMEFEIMIKYFNDSNYFYIVGKEIGEAGTPHLQGFCMSKDSKKFRLTKLEKLLIRDGVKPMRNFRAKGSARENYEYCSKDGDYISNMNKLFREAYKDLKPDKDFMIEILNMINKPIDDRDIYWYYGKQGLGKTWFVKYLVKNHGAILLGLRAADNRNAILQYVNTNGYFPDLIIINIGWDKNLDKVNYSMFEEIKDMCFYSGKYEGGMICGPNPNLIVFANDKPESTNKKFVVKKIT